MVNPGVEMSTDYVLPGAPNKRLVFAGESSAAAILVYELGGNANVLIAITFDYRAGRIWTATLNNYSVRSVQELRNAVKQGDYRSFRPTCRSASRSAAHNGD
jgi:hypothetical protein